MTIDSLFVILCLSVTSLLSWASPRKYRMHAMVACTGAFLAYVDHFSFLILTAFALIAYYVPRAFGFSSRVLWSLIVLFAIVFVALKGLNTFAQGFLMPLGFSFYSFRVIHYLFEGYKDKLPLHGLIHFLAYLFFLPTLVVGPIHRFPSFKDDMEKRSFNAGDASWALERILYGYAKIVVLGNYFVGHKLGQIILSVESGQPWVHAYLSSLHYWMNLYLQFSGYADIAIGFSLLMGFRVMENFNYPFLASNISDFWSRWHISLSSWIREYVYAPLAAATRRRFFAIAVAMVFFGLWHELSLNYIFWGIYHACGITVWHRFQSLKRSSSRLRLFTDTKIFSLLAWFLTFNFVIMSAEVRRLVFELLMP